MLCLFFSFSQAQIEFDTFVITDTTQTSYQTIDARGVDLDGDGDLDVLAGSRVDDKVAWYENLDGQGTFGPQNLISRNIDDVKEVIHADLDGDGDQDVISLARNLNSVLWHENLDGQGNFGSPQLLENDLEDPEYVRAADLDGDGDMDIIAQGQGFMDDYTRWYENLDGLGTFASGVSLTTLSKRGRGLDIGDVDGDGDLDVVVATTIDDIYWIPNNGNGVFSPEIEIDNNAERNYDLKVGDLDGDGDLDVVVSQNEVDGAVRWYENSGGGTFGAAQAITDEIQFPERVVLVDVDNDTDLDILISSRNEFAFFWLENLNGAGNFSNEQVIFDEVRIPISIFGGDFDGDNTVDALTASQSDGIIGLHRNPSGDGVFLEREAVNNTFYYPEFVDAVDVDEDGDLDLMIGEDGNGTIAWLENTNGLGVFSDRKNIISVAQSNIKYFVNADMDGDGDLDLVSGARDGRARIGWRRNLSGPAQYSEFIPILDGNLFTADEVHAFDMDGDGDLDVLSCTADNLISWFENTDGNGSFGPQQIVGNVNNPRTVYALDVDSDDDLDVVAHSDLDNELVWFENLDGLGTFGPSILIRENVFDVEELNAGDIDNDGDDDLLSNLTYYENVGGSFVLRQILNGNGVWSVRLVDFDRDSDLDIVWGERFGGTVNWIENTDGFGDFGNFQVISEGFSSVYGINLGDIDGDGDLDVASASREDGRYAWHKATLTTNLITGFTRYDLEGDSCDPDDAGVPNLLVYTEQEGGYTYGTLTQATGNYQFFVDQGNFTTTLPYIPTYFTGSPDQYQNTFSSTGEVFEGDFCLEADPNINDLRVMIYPASDARPGFSARYFIVFRNLGTTTLSGTVDFQFDNSKMEFDVANQTPIAQTANSLTFEFFDLPPFGSDWVRMDFNIFPPPTTDIDDILVFESNIFPVAGDANPDDNSTVLEQLVIGSYDPNDIQVVEGEEIFENEVDNYLHYLIRFQNTGTASAINVRVTNPIEENLDWTTLEVEALSHDGEVEITDGRQVDFIFDDIDLPPQSETESGSQGFIAYRIKPASNVGLGDSMSNDANIYFDFNPPILTNTVTTTVVDNLQTASAEINSINLLPNPANDKVIISSMEQIVKLTVYNYLGQELMLIEDAAGIDRFSVVELSEGMYFVNLLSEKGTSETVKLVKR